MKRRRRGKHEQAAVWTALRGHFGRLPLPSLVTASRTFPLTARVDLQGSIDKIFLRHAKTKLLGVHHPYSHETVTFAHLVHAGDHPVVIAPLQHEEIDVGEVQPARCLQRGLWLSRTGAVPFATLLSPAQRYSQMEGVHVEVAVPPGAPGVALSRSFLDELEKAVNQSGSYRGKVLSLEATSDYRGQGGQVRVHRLRGVGRHEVILPEKTLRLLDRNVREFVAQRERLRALGMAMKKGLLFYGPPGTGKTHTIHYLAGQLPDHTTLLITAEQMGLLGHYFQLARFLQPTMVVIEDVDLIARDRTRMRGPCEESLLNTLLNEMDGLREDAAILFVLTTNRPEELEAALASRPGRIDQAIEFPLPDDDGRRKLIALYSRGLGVPAQVGETIVRRTAGTSAAFIKELMRRCAQYQIRSDESGPVSLVHIENALDEMLIDGGSLNVKLLGGAVDA